MGEIARWLCRSGLLRRSRPYLKSRGLPERERQPIRGRDPKPGRVAQDGGRNFLARGGGGGVFASFSLSLGGVLVLEKPRCETPRAECSPSRQRPPPAPSSGR